MTAGRLTAEDRQRIAAQLRELRRRRGLEQRDVARAAAVGLGTFQMIERGIGRNVRRENIEKVARALDTTLDALVHAPNPPNVLLEAGMTIALNQEDLEMARVFHSAITDTRLAVIAMLTEEIGELARAGLSRAVLVLFRLREEHRAKLIDIILTWHTEETQTMPAPTVRSAPNQNHK